MKFINEKKRGQCVESELLGLQFSPISIAFYFSLPNIMFYPRLIRSFFLSFQIDIDLAISWPALLSIRKMKLYIVAFTLLVLCAGCSCTKVPGTTMEPTEANSAASNSCQTHSAFRSVEEDSQEGNKLSWRQVIASIWWHMLSLVF